MTVAQPALEHLSIPETPFGAVVARQLSVWPFAARTARLFLLVDPSLPDQSMRRGLLRAMQQAYFASDGYSQTRAVREAALAAHYVLRHHNRDVLPLDQVNAASAVAAIRGDVAYVALAGQAAAFAWRDGQLTGQRGILRLPRPLGLETDPLINLWSTLLESGDRLVLVCGATWRSHSARCIHEILSATDDSSLAEQQLALALGSVRPAGVLVVGSGSGSRKKRHLSLVTTDRPERAREPKAPTVKGATRKPFRLRRWLTSLFGIALLATVTMAAFAIVPGSESPAETHLALVMQDRVDRVSPAMAVRLGPSATNVADLAVGDTALYTLDVVEGSVRAFALDALDQQPTPETLVARAGATLDPRGRKLTTPVAMQYLNDTLAVIDQARTVVEIDANRKLNVRSIPTSLSWQALGALGSDPTGHLLFLDSGSRSLLEYASLSQRAADPPRVRLDSSSAPGLAFDHVADVFGLDDLLIARLDDGSVHLFDSFGSDKELAVHPADGKPVMVQSIAPDRFGGLFLADPANTRILQIGVDGGVVRQLRDPALGGLRQIQSSVDGRRVFGLVASGVLVFDTPDL